MSPDAGELDPARLPGGRLPPLEIIASEAHNVLGEVRLDLAEAAEAAPATGSGQLTPSALRAAAARDFDSALALLAGHPGACLSLGHLHREACRYSDALMLYARAAALEAPALPSRVAGRKRQLPDWREDWLYAPRRRCLPIAAYHLAHLLSRLGRHEEAVPVMRRFSCRFRIAPSVWCREELPAASHQLTELPAAPRLFRGAIPAVVSDALRRGFAPRAPYWRENDYQNREYFSWSYDPSAEPSNTVEEFIRHILLPLLGRDDIVSAEWWAHTRPRASDLGHQLHFDMDELTLEASGRVLHPVLSAVAYLSPACGGSTLVLDETIDGELAEQGWLVTPECGAVMVFPGDRLHGVLPSLSPPDAGATAATLLEPTKDEQRLTLMVGLWNRTDFADGARGPIGPQSPVPTGPDWPATLPLTGARASPLVERGPVRHVSPVWERLQTPSDEGEASGNVLKLPQSVDQRFFLAGPSAGSAGAWRKRVLADHGVGPKRRPKKKGGGQAVIVGAADVGKTA
eukprot:NODE_5632_length_1749_cov_6.642417.p1 GENE.NODE_5632_length_1749_cov_6.642417~~NODE_5632_length_1749_cov_6.642417.p1  ORF type:complete len:516 (-),score=82.47 NODE_5632_length_1749_cov_6.642417:127-1674(-)